MIDTNFYDAPTVAGFEGLRYAETDDPRVLAIMAWDDDPQAPDGDAFAPAYYIEYGMTLHPAGSTCRDDEVAEAWERAWSEYRDSDKVERYLRLFYDSTVREVEISRGDYIVLFNTPDWRESCGIKDTSTDALAGDIKEWKARGMGDVWGVGWAWNPSRVSHDADVDLDDFSIEIECWGCVGRDYAEESARDGADWFIAHSRETEDQLLPI